MGYANPHNSIRKNSEDIGSYLNIINEEYSYKVKSQKNWLFSNSKNKEIEYENPGIIGNIQINNAATAIQAIDCCEKIVLDHKKTNIGLRKSFILGRFQVLKTSPLTILDMAHNEQSIENLIENLNKYYPQKDYHAVFGILKDKKLDDILIMLKRKFKSWHISNSNNERALNVNELKKNNFFISENTNVYDNIENAYNGAKSKIENKNDIIVVFGSSYTVAPVINMIGQ